MIYINNRVMFKTGNISSDPDTNSHILDLNSTIDPIITQVDQSVQATTNATLEALDETIINMVDELEDLI